ncbi:MAG: NUDIX hydrolase [Syntrophomonadaceae bacterium]|jgi:ADP-ribose pyrophosphatase|nr:NUDIX hydrolase [Syntrophomonadaceae bacterium]
MELFEKTIASKDIYQGRILNLRVDRVALPDGSESTREIIEHSGAVAIVAIDEDKNVWMVKQYRKAVEEVLMEIPAGTLEKGEEPLACAKRELAEETGLIAENWQHIVSYYSAPGFVTEKLHLYLATGLNQGDTNPDRDEFLYTIKMPLTDAYKAIFAGQIQDGKSIIGIQYTCNLLAGR